MKELQIAAKSSYKVTLEPGTYWWCACGHSKKQPFCDSSHKMTDIKPLKFEVTETRRYSMCGCKHTKKPPFCDHAHREL